MEEPAATPLPCPSCAQPMHAFALRRRSVGSLEVDLCFGCCLIWFDQGESAQLAPAAVIELFQAIQAHRDGVRTRLAQSLVCPRCTQHLTLTHDMCKSGALQYFRCATDGGRLTPFFQFLREKDFLRALTPAELQQVRVKIKQLQCSNCGAPVDLEHNTSCTYCGSPIAMIDADAIENALQVWVNRDTRERDAQARGDKLLEAMQQRSEDRPLFTTPAWSQNTDALTRVEGGSDLIQLCISALGDIFTSQ